MTLLEKFERELSEAQAKINTLQEFPDLHELKNPWNNIILASKSVNAKATEFEVRNECDCCRGAKVYALPYIDFQGIRIYSNPCAVAFAKNYETPLSDDDWDEDENWDDFNGTLLDNIAEWIDKHEDNDDIADLFDETDN